MLESLFAFLFKYRPVIFQAGRFELSAPWPLLALALIGAAIAIPAVLSYARAKGKARDSDRAVLAALRLGVLAVVLFCLLRPVLVVSSVAAQQTFLAILVDDSRSMRIADRNGRPRGDFVRESLGDAEKELRKQLGDRFVLRFFRFSSDAERVEDVDALGFSGPQTHLHDALARTRAELAGLPLSGMVVVTDGADNGSASGSESILSLKAAGVPVYSVGVGREHLDRDIELSRAETPRSVLAGTSLVVDLMVRQRGFGGGRVPLYVEDGGRIIAEQQIELPRDGEPAPVRVRFTAEAAGARRFRFRIPVQNGEMVAQNNEQEGLISVVDRREKVLYIEGEPRFELKFARRAVEEDKNLQLVVLQRTADNKFLRLDVDGGEELAGGFPRTREELFAYRGLILGSIEASFFTLAQLRMIADFVSERGGGLLMLGGRHSFGEGGYAGTPVEDVLPVSLERGSDVSFAAVKVQPTRSGAVHAATQIGATERESAERWRALPAVSSVNSVRRLKPGAVALLSGEGEGLRGDRVVLAYQRFGRGKALALPIQDSWLWQMHADIPLEDATHETFWRQILRWLVDDVPGPVQPSLPQDRVRPGEPLTISATVTDSAYLALNDGEVVAHVAGPSGFSAEVPMEWTVDRDGEYRASFVAPNEGMYEVRVDAKRDGRTLGGAVAYAQAAESNAEFFDAGMRAPLLRRIAEETGGRFYTPETVSSLPEDVRYTGAGASVVEEKDLWDMPIVFLLLIALAGAEWGYRRYRGLA